MDRLAKEKRTGYIDETRLMDIRFSGLSTALDMKYSLEVMNLSGRRLSTEYNRTLETLSLRRTASSFSTAVWNAVW